MIDLASLQDATLEYARAVDELYGLYLDTTTGFVQNARLIAQLQLRLSSDLQNPDKVDFFYGYGAPNSPTSRVLHRTTHGEYKARNAVGGANHVKAAQLLLVLLFEYWESEHRGHIAAALRVDHGEVKLPVLGDIRLLRQDVIHHRGITRHETVRKLMVLSGFVPDTPIGLTGEQVEAIVVQIKSGLDALVMESGGPDPNHRFVWRFE